MYVPVSSLEKHKEKMNRTKVDKVLSALATFAWVKHSAVAEIIWRENWHVVAGACILHAVWLA
jgi:hypothetical protein